jgi:hypothetical protein
MRLFFEAFPVTSNTTILDVGGAMETWATLPVQPRITLINMPRAQEAFPGGGPSSGKVRGVAGDACLLPFCDRAFDIVFSNSVIEHVGGPERQRKFATEVRRVGKAYWVQTPNRYFFLETHLLTPFVHWLPAHVKEAVITRFSAWESLCHPSPGEKEYFIRHMLHDVRLLGPREMRNLFPDATLRQRALAWHDEIANCVVGWRILTGAAQSVARV